MRKQLLLRFNLKGPVTRVELVLPWVFFVFAKYYKGRCPQWFLEFLVLFGLIVGIDQLVVKKPAVKKLLLSSFLLLAGWVPVLGILYFKDICIGLFLLANWFVIGRVIMRWIRPLEMTRLESHVYGLAIGMVLYSYVILLLGLRGFLSIPSLTILSFGVLALGASSIPDISHLSVPAFNFNEAISAINVRVERLTGFDIAMALALTLLGLMFVIGNFSPPIADDDLGYHYAAAKIFANNHRIFFLPFFVNFNLPFSEEFLYTAGLVLGGTYASIGFINLVFMSLLVLGFIAAFKQYVPSLKGALCAFLMFFSIIYYVFHASQGTVDLKYLLFVLLALLGLVHGFNSQDNKWFLLSAVSTGCSLSFRYHGVILWAFGGFAIAWAAFQTGKRRYIIPGLVWVFVVLLVGCPFYLKNWAYTGNPIFPTSTRWFKGFLGDPDLSEMWRLFTDPTYPFLFGSFGLGMGWRRLLTTPWDITFNGGLFGGYDSSPVFLALAPLMLWQVKQSKLVRGGLVFSIFYFVAWFFQMHQMRFLNPAIVILTFGIVHSWWTLRKKITNQLIRILIGTFLLLPSFDGLVRIYMVLFPNLFLERIPVVCGIQSAKTFLHSRLPIFDLIDYANTHLSKDSVVFSPWDSKMFYLDRRYLLGEPFTQIYVDYRRFDGPDNFLARLKGLDITHIILYRNPEEFVNPLMGPPGAALILLSHELSDIYFEKLYSTGPWTLARIRYPPNLRPYNPKLFRDPVQIGDFLFNHGSIDFAQREYAWAASLNRPTALAKEMQIVNMTPFERGQYFFGHCVKLKDHSFLRASLEEYQRALQGTTSDSSERSLVLQRIEEIKAHGLKIASHIWGNI